MKIPGYLRHKTGQARVRIKGRDFYLGLDSFRQQSIKAGNCRLYVNKQTGRLVAMFR